MKIIVGLGNPEEKYESIRHNTGFMFVDALASDKQIAPVERVIELREEKRFQSQFAKIKHNGEDVLLVKPLTYMNSSGKAVSSIINYYKASANDLIVALDDIDLPIGVVRVRCEGGSAGHKGLQNIIDCIDSDKFVRFRIGILGDSDKKNPAETAEYVLNPFSKREFPLVEQSIDKATAYLLTYLGKKEPIPSHTFEVKFDSLK
jgi:peptidyl-tRNA hydrolase, PTH1 family